MYDYIIVGSGPAGCVLANRLTEDPKVNILLLEAGQPDRNPLIHMPAGFAKLTGKAESWGYSTAPQKHLDNRELWYPQGKVLGGGSSINAQVFTCGNPLDYDEWADEHSCDGWSHADILPYFRRSEDNPRFSNKWHGVGGPLQVSDPEPQAMTQVFVRACQEAGFPYNSDFNGEVQEGFGFYQTTTRNGRRSSARVGPVRGNLLEPGKVAV
jgi:choline dehydrogenase-like flavoprotein